MSFLQRSKSMLNEKIKEVLISTVDFREFEPVPIIIRLNVKEGMGKHEIITAIPVSYTHLTLPTIRLV